VQKIVLLTGLAWGFLNTPCQAGFVFSKEVKQGMEAAVAMQHGEARRQLLRLREKQPDNSLAYLLEDYIDFYALIFSENPQAFIEIEKQLAPRLNALERDKSVGPWAGYAKGRMHLNRALLHALAGNYFTAAIQLNKAQGILEATGEKYPEFPPVQRELALLRVIFGMVPDQYQWAANLVGWKGNEEEGIKQLKALLPRLQKSDYAVFESETRLMLMYILGFSREDARQAIDLVVDDLKLTSRYLSVIFLLGKLSPKVGQNDQAIHYLINRPQSSDYQQFPLLDFYLAKSYLYQADPRALTYFEIYLSGQSPRIYRHQSCMRMAYFYHLQGHEAGVRHSLERMRALPAPVDESDKQAMKEASAWQKNWPNRQLLEAQMLHDGGYFSKALEVLNQVDVQSLGHDEKMMWMYRRGRVLHDWNKPEQAISSYKACVQLASDDQQYQPANACYLLGVIYERKGQTSEAKYWYHKSLSFNRHPYANSMHMKAKAGLRRLKSQ
jgi:tetratricopeptide (TPR) repeat protein